MIEVQIRKPCSKPKLKKIPGAPLWFCPECNAGGLERDVVHSAVSQWVSLERAVQMAHEEQARKGSE